MRTGLRIIAMGLVSYGLSGAAHARGSEGSVFVLGDSIPNVLRTAQPQVAVQVGDGAAAIRALYEEQARFFYVEKFGSGEAVDLLSVIGAARPGAGVTFIVNTCGWRVKPDYDTLAPLVPSGSRLAVSHDGPDCDSAAYAEILPEIVSAPDEALAQILQSAGYQLAGGASAPRPRGAVTASLDTSIIVSGIDLSTGSLQVLQPQSGGTIQGAADPVPALAVAAQPQVINASAQMSAPTLPRRAGMPEPSVILGELATLLAADLRGSYGMPFPQRERIRQLDPLRFQTMLEAGAFDPDEGQEPAAIQSELLRMACYSGAVDGRWGAGSAAALTRYQDSAGAGITGSAPDRAMFRAMVLKLPDVCPAVPVAAVAPVAPTLVRTPRGGGTQRPTNTVSQNRPRPVADPAPAPAQPARPTTPQLNINPLGSGLYR